METPGINSSPFTLVFENKWFKPLYKENMNKIKVQVYNKSNNDLPIYATEFAAGIDLKAMVQDNARILIYPGKRELIHTGLYVAIPEGYEIQIRPRSGLALKQLITVLNTPGTIDSDYRGEIGVILINHGDEAVGISNGDRIAQAIIAPVNQIEWDKVNTFEELPTTNRGTGGFGSTGIKNNLDSNLIIPKEVFENTSLQDLKNVLDGKPLEGTILDHIDNVK